MRILIQKMIILNRFKRDLLGVPPYQNSGQESLVLNTIHLILLTCTKYQQNCILLRDTKCHHKVRINNGNLSSSQNIIVLIMIILTFKITKLKHQNLRNMVSLSANYVRPLGKKYSCQATLITNEYLLTMLSASRNILKYPIYRKSLNDGINFKDYQLTLYVHLTSWSQYPS